MPELTNIELQAVSGGAMIARPPVCRRPVRVVYKSERCERDERRCGGSPVLAAR